MPTSNVTSGAIAERNERDQVSGWPRASRHASGLTACWRAGRDNRICVEYIDRREHLVLVPHAQDGLPDPQRFAAAIRVRRHEADGHEARHAPPERLVPDQELPEAPELPVTGIEVREDHTVVCDQDRTICDEVATVNGLDVCEWVFAVGRRTVLRERPSRPCGADR